MSDHKIQKYVYKLQNNNLDKLPTYLNKLNFYYSQYAGATKEQKNQQLKQEKIISELKKKINSIKIKQNSSFMSTIMTEINALQPNIRTVFFEALDDVSLLKIISYIVSVPGTMENVFSTFDNTSLLKIIPHINTESIYLLKYLNKNNVLNETQSNDIRQQIIKKWLNSIHQNNAIYKNDDASDLLKVDDYNKLIAMRPNYIGIQLEKYIKSKENNNNDIIKAIRRYKAKENIYNVYSINNQIFIDFMPSGQVGNFGIIVLIETKYVAEFITTIQDIQDIQKTLTVINTTNNNNNIFVDLSGEKIFGIFVVFCVRQHWYNNKLGVKIIDEFNLMNLKLYQLMWN
jgi:hypothetical protein